MGEHDDYPALPRLFTPAEAARALAQTEHYVREKARRREWPHSRMARGAVRFSVADLEAIIGMTHQPVGEPTDNPWGLTPRSLAYHRRYRQAGGPPPPRHGRADRA
jgi:hypothetical protein